MDAAKIGHGTDVVPVIHLVDRKNSLPKKTDARLIGSFRKLSRQLKPITTPYEKESEMYNIQLAAYKLLLQALVWKLFAWKAV